MSNHTRWAFFRVLLFATVLTLGRLETSAEDFRLRLTAANLTSGNLQSYTPGEGLRILDGLNPDVVMVQEFNYGSNTDTEFRGMVTTTFGPDYSYYRQPGNLQIPNGIISRYPILQAGTWDDTQVSNRDFVWARIDIPGPIDLWVISVHLLTASAGVRNTEATALLQLIDQNIPASAFLAIGGDFNTDTHSESALSTLNQVVKTTGPYPADKNGNENTNANRNKPYDGVYVDADLQSRAAAVQIGSSTFASGLVLDTRVYTPLSDLSPARFSDSAASNMQHMAVVKDFVIPVPEPQTGMLVCIVMAFVFARRPHRTGRDG